MTKGVQVGFLSLHVFSRSRDYTKNKTKAFRNVPTQTLIWHIIDTVSG